MKKITIDQHREFLDGLLHDQDFDDIDAAMDDMPGPAQLRKQSEVDRLMSLLDEIGKDGAR